MTEIKVLCPESRMYQLELAGLEIFHKLYFPERSPSFLSLRLSPKLFFSHHCLIILSSPWQPASKLQPSMGPLAINIKATARNLCVTFYSQLNTEPHVNTLIKSWCFHLRNITKMESALTFPDLERIIHAFVFSHLNCCSTLFIQSMVDNNLLLLYCWASFSAECCCSYWDYSTVIIALV